MGPCCPCEWDTSWPRSTDSGQEVAVPTFNKIVGLSREAKMKRSQRPVCRLVGLSYTYVYICICMMYRPSKHFLTAQRTVERINGESSREGGNGDQAETEAWSSPTPPPHLSAVITARESLGAWAIKAAGIFMLNYRNAS